MAREEIKVTIAAEDDASKVIDKVADKADDLERNDVEVDVKADDEASRTIEALRADLQRLEDMVIELSVKLDTSQVEQGLGRVRQVSKDTGDEVDRIGDKADQSRSVLANMAGNATQDIGELGGVAGTAGVAIGQLAEYATEGNINLKKLVQVAGPMLALGVATKVVADHMARAKAADAFSAKQVEGWVEAMREGATLTEAIGKSWANAGKVEVEIGNDIVDLNGVLAETNTTAEQFAELQRKSADEIDAWGAKMRAAGADATATNLVVVAAKSQHDDLADAEKQAAVNAEVFGDAAEVEAGKLDEVVEAVDRGEQATERWTTAFEKLLGLFTAEDAARTAVDSLDAITDAQEAVNAATFEFGENSEEAQDANRRLQGQISSAKQDVLAYAEEVENIPPERITDILALIDQGKLTEAETAMTQLERDRAAGVFPGVDPSSSANAERHLTNLARRRDAEIWIKGILADPRQAQLFSTLGRNGGLVIGPSSMPTGVAPMPLPSSTTTVNVNLPRGTRPSDMVRAVENYSRRNGRGVLR